MILRLASHPHGLRLYVVGCRVHHGPGFAVLAALAWRLKRRRIAAACALWAASDYRDFPFRDCNNH